MTGIVKKGTPFGTMYKRTSSRSMDSSETFDSLEEARIYAKNANCEDVPYPGQIITVKDKAYLLKIDPDMPDDSAKGFYHCKLELMGSNNDNDDRYVRKDIAETIGKLMTFLEGINAKGVSTLEQIQLLNDIVSTNFAAGSTGFGITKDEKGNYHLDIDFVNIRRKLTVDEIQVQQSSYIGGKQYNTAAGMICSKVENNGTSWRCYFKTTDAEGRTVRNTFEVGDQAICETFNLDQQGGGISGNHYYWRLVTGKGSDYIDLSKSDCDRGSDEPRVGDSIVQLGNRTEASRQGAICWDSVTEGGPYVRVYRGINSYHLPQPNIDLNPEESVIKAKLISEATGKDLDTTLDEMNTDLRLIKQQTDKEYTIWFFDYEPTLENAPASEWDTNQLKTLHEQDLFYNRVTGFGYRFEKSDDTWTWNSIADFYTLKALENAAKAQDTADGKRRIFVEQPTSSQAYDVGDLWVNATYSDKDVTYKNDSLVCKTAKASGKAFSISHWQPSNSATTASIENLGDRINLAVRDLEGNTAEINVMKDSISALVEGVHFDSNGKITNINTSGLVSTSDFNTLLSKKVNFDSTGHITNIDKSGLITESNLATMFAEKTAEDGYVKKSYISAFITELPDGSFQSNATIEADNINFNGKVLMNGKMLVDETGGMIINDLVANNGTFNGVINATLFYKKLGNWGWASTFNLDPKRDGNTFVSADIVPNVINLPPASDWYGLSLEFCVDNPSRAVVATTFVSPGRFIGKNYYLKNIKKINLTAPYNFYLISLGSNWFIKEMESQFIETL